MGESCHGIVPATVGRKEDLCYPNLKNHPLLPALEAFFFAMNADSAEHQIAVLCFPVKETLNSTDFPRKRSVFLRKSGVFFLTKASPSYIGISELF